ncbi:MAG: proteobacterial dedicated sortase system histidine kinase [endosymbiont of Seepiophila jonesi]|uniref:histidine kinase n=1 Tax=endosymbiont of Lamellibrachia luymesi TaxID=2200907 RepID=A0A370DA72_9GAMM|nr:MAG: proteobacterial dedicated sortase system histidine kinase [endosymbiont of Lamellibrachia luymesi]RDH92436.1 MAG: proteobacterial dedicated sortase system histidine kinase [endosymbiont of Seepiophila jonesi]
MRRRFYQGLRFKLLLVSLTLLAIPWAGYRYVIETESFLRASQEEVLLGRAELIANLLSQSSNLPTIPADSQNPVSILYAHRLTQPILLDGYTDDWRTLLEQKRYFRSSETDPKAAAFSLLMGIYEGDLYLMLQVKDETVIYPSPPTDNRKDAGDHLRIALMGDDGEIANFQVSTAAPGWVTAEPLAGAPHQPLIRGEWQETKTGYNLELRIPHSLFKQRLSLALSDRDGEADGTAATTASTSGLMHPESLAFVVTSYEDVETLLAGFAYQESRIRVINRQRWVIGQNGRLAPGRTPNTQKMGLLNGILNLVLPLPDSDFLDDQEYAARLDGPEIRQALLGNPTVHRRRADDVSTVVLAAAYPIKSDRGVTGAVVMEQTTQRILTMQQQALKGIFQITLILFLITGGLLLGFATLLTGRIHRLHNRVEDAVSPDGRILHGLGHEKTADEIGDLGRSFSSVLERLQEYNRYLEAMASRLSHEFRTPLAMVKSSLENLQHDEDPTARTRYLSRATEGIDRLTLILDRMREATRLEQTLQQAEKTPLDLVELVRVMRNNYAVTYHEVTIETRLPDNPVVINAAPELIVQALDKLVSNAVDFHLSGTPLTLAVTQETDDSVRLSVINQGPPLPETMQHHLFDSMVSVRPHTSDLTHLGLGLYLVRLISEFHQGCASAENLKSGDGVSVSLVLAANP